jgi:hypothetical protein
MLIVVLLEREHLIVLCQGQSGKSLVNEKIVTVSIIFHIITAWLVAVTAGVKFNGS